MSSFMTVGDVHLGKNLNLGKVDLQSNSRLEDQFKLLNWVLDQAKLEEVNHIIFTGDLFEDPSPEIFILKKFASWLKSATDSGFDLHFIEGNHDFVRMNESYLSSLDIFKELHLNKIHFYRDVTSLVIEDVNLILAPFRDRKSLFMNSQESALEKISQLILDKKSKELTNVVIGHLSIKDSIPIGDEIDDLTNEIFIPSEFFENFDFTWLGHIHKFQVFNKKPYVSHIGSLDISNFGEKDQEKFINVFNIKNKTFKYIKVPVRKYSIIEITIPEKEQDSTKYVLNHLKSLDIKDQIVKLDIKHSSSANSSSHKKEIESFLKEKSAFYVNSIVESKKLDLVKKKSDVVIKDKTNVIESLNIFAEKSDLVPTNLSVRFLEIAKKIAKDNK